MLSETNKTVSRRFFDEVFGNGKLNVLDEIIAKDQVNSGPGTLPGLPTGPEGAKQLVTEKTGVVKASLRIDGFETHGSTVKVKRPLVNVYLIN